MGCPRESCQSSIRSLKRLDAVIDREPDESRHCDLERSDDEQRRRRVEVVPPVGEAERDLVAKAAWQRGPSAPGLRPVLRSPMMVIQHHESSYWQERVRDQFDRLYLEGARNPRVMAIAVHPYIHGVPHRIKYFEAAYDYIRKHRGVWLTTGEEIYEWYKRTAQSSEPPPRRVAGGARARTAATPTRSRVTRD